MKKLTNPQKGRVIFNRCKNDLPELLDMLKTYAEKVLQTEAQLKISMGESMATYWLNMAQDTLEIVNLKKKALSINMQAFVWELFERPRFLFVCHFFSDVVPQVVENKSILKVMADVFPPSKEE